MAVFNSAYFIGRPSALSLAKGITTRASKPIIAMAYPKYSNLMSVNEDIEGSAMAAIKTKTKVDATIDQSEVDTTFCLSGALV